jgi:hypothetical protein
VRLTSNIDAAVSTFAWPVDTPSGSLRLTSPLPGTTLVVGQTLNVSFTSTGYGLVGQTLSILIVPSGSTTVIASISASSPISTTTVLWVVPSTMVAPASYQVRLVSAPDSRVTAQSPPFFLTPFVPASALTLTVPSTLGYSFFQGQTTTISWIATGALASSGAVVITLMNGVYFVANVTTAPLNSMSVGSFAWTVPASLAPATLIYSLTIRSVSDATIFASSPLITVLAPPAVDSVAMVAPTTGAVWARRTTYNISWAAFGVSVLASTVTVTVRVASTGALVAVVGTGLPAASMSIAWAGVAANGTGLMVAGLVYAVTVTSDALPSVSASVNVTALQAPTYGLAVGLPTAGFIALKGSPLTVTWSAYSPAVQTSNVKVELLQAGLVIATMASSVPASYGQLSWLVPASAATATTYTVRVTQANDLTIFASSAVFTIATGTLQLTYPPDLTLAPPLTNIVWVFGRGFATNITWASSGSLISAGTVKVELWYFTSFSYTT